MTTAFSAHVFFTLSLLAGACSASSTTADDARVYRVGIVGAG